VASTNHHTLVDPPHFLFDWVEEGTHTGMLRIAGAETLRGIPVAAVKGGLGGTVAGTQPEAELMRRERRRGA